METPKILLPALRQYRYKIDIKNNDKPEDFVCGFDYNETIKIVANLQSKATNDSKPFKVDDSKRTVSLNGGTRYFCPKCDESGIEALDNYCAWCGVKLKW